MITNAQLHYSIIRTIIDNGHAPTTQDLMLEFDANEHEVVEALYALERYHGVVLHPNEPKVWVIHPFSLAPTNFYVVSKAGSWWGNCAWCSLGVAALLNEDVTIKTSIGAEGKPLEVTIINGEIQEKDYYVHFPIPMKHAWNNVMYTCSTMLVFENETQIDRWCQRHSIPRGDIQPIENIWNFSKVWYGNHLDPNWTKWTMDEAKAMFKAYHLTGEIWALGDSKERF